MVSSEVRSFVVKQQVLLMCNEEGLESGWASGCSEVGRTKAIAMQITQSVWLSICTETAQTHARNPLAQSRLDRQDQNELTRITDTILENI